MVALATEFIDGQPKGPRRARRSARSRQELKRRPAPGLNQGRAWLMLPGSGPWLPPPQPELVQLCLPQPLELEPPQPPQPQPLEAPGRGRQVRAMHQPRPGHDRRDDRYRHRHQHGDADDLDDVVAHEPLRFHPVTRDRAANASGVRAPADAVVLG